MAPSTIEFTARDWLIPRPVTVTGVDDDYDNPGNRREAIIRHAASGGGYDGVLGNPVRVTVTDDDGPATISVAPTLLSVAEDGGTASYAVSLSQPPTHTVQVAVSSGDEAAATTTPAFLTFTQADWSPRTVTVTGVEDEVDNPDGRRSVTISHAVTSQDLDYDDLPADPVEVTVVDATDDDGVSTTTPPTGVPGVEVSEEGIWVDEDGGAGTYTLALESRPTGSVRIGLTSGDETIATVRPAGLTFTTEDWWEPQLVTVTGVDDDLVNPAARTTTINHVVRGGGYEVVTVDPMPVTVADDDEPGIAVSLSQATLDEYGEGDRQQYTVRLNTRPTADVVVEANSADPSVANAQPSSLTFTPNNWFIPQDVTLIAANDSLDNKPDDFDYTGYTPVPVMDDDDTRVTTITHAVSVSGGGYDAEAVAEHTLEVTVYDDDEPGHKIYWRGGSVEQWTLLEEGEAITAHADHRTFLGTPVRQYRDYCFQLTSQPKGEITASVVSSDRHIAAATGSTAFDLDAGHWNKCDVTAHGNNEGGIAIGQSLSAGQSATFTITIHRGDGGYYSSGKTLAEFDIVIVE